jgi:hypothetical protein
MSTPDDAIWVYKDNDMWHVDCGGGVMQDHPSRELAVQDAQRVADAENRPLDVEDQ